MTEKPDKPNSGPSGSGGEEDFEIPPRPEQVWPPPDGAARPPKRPQPKPGEEAWADEGDLEELDRAIEDLEPLGVDEADEIVAGGSAEEIVAGQVAERLEPVVARASAIACRVRTQSERELSQLWASLFFSAERKPPQAVIVTAVRRREGATQIATSLALIGAGAGREHHVALVDFNLRNPAVADILNIPAQPGVTDVLDGRASLEEALHALRLPNSNHLYVLPAGPAVDQPLGLLKSRQAQSLIGRLRERFNQTIIDTAAANEYPDPQIVGALVDGALLVVRAGQTPRETAAQAKKRLELAGVRCLGLVLNQRKDHVPGVVYRMT